MPRRIVSSLCIRPAASAHSRNPLLKQFVRQYSPGMTLVWFEAMDCSAGFSGWSLIAMSLRYSQVVHDAVPNVPVYAAESIRADGTPWVKRMYHAQTNSTQQRFPGQGIHLNEQLTWSWTL